MSEPMLVSVVALCGWLVLMLYGYRSYRISGRKTLTMVLIWLGIFIVAILGFSALMQ